MKMHKGKSKSHRNRNSMNGMERVQLPPHCSWSGHGPNCFQFGSSKLCHAEFYSRCIGFSAIPGFTRAHRPKTLNSIFLWIWPNNFVSFQSVHKFVGISGIVETPFSNIFICVLVLFNLTVSMAEERYLSLNTRPVHLNWQLKSKYVLWTS